MLSQEALSPPVFCLHLLPPRCGRTSLGPSLPGAWTDVGCVVLQPPSMRAILWSTPPSPLGGGLWGVQKKNPSLGIMCCCFYHHE